MINDYFDEKKNLYETLLNFLENSDYEKDYFEQINEIISQNKYEEDREEFTHFLQLFVKLANDFHREKDFLKKIQQIVQYYGNTIKKLYTNYEIFQFFQSNKMILLYLLENKILLIDENISNGFLNENYGMFFYPEIKEIIGEEKSARIKQKLLEYDNSVFIHFEDNRHEGENDSYICKLIRYDKIEDFVTFISQNQISLTSKINQSFFETNNFLLMNQPTLIQYSAFFGSIQVFKYLEINNVEFDPDLWFYAIHGRNADIIHILESYEIPFNYEQIFVESIKCHHNDIADYIQNNLSINGNILSQKKFDIQILLNLNYQFLQPNLYDPFIFYLFSSMQFYKLINLFIKNDESGIIYTIINKSYFFKSSLNQLIFFLIEFNNNCIELYFKITVKILMEFLITFLNDIFYYIFK